MLSLTVHYIIDIIFFLFFVHFIFIYILFSVVHMSLVKQCIFLCISGQSVMYDKEYYYIE